MQPPPPTNHVTHHGIDMPNVMFTIDVDYHRLDPLTPGEYHGTTRMAGQDEHGRQSAEGHTFRRVRGSLPAAAQ